MFLNNLQWQLTQAKSVQVMSVQALKMKRNLEKIKKERLLFENKKSLLDAEMSKGRINMTKIKKGLRNNEIVDSPMDVSMNSTENVSLNSTMSLPKATAPQKKSKHLSIAHVEQNNRNPSGSLSPRPSSGTHTLLHLANWICFHAFKFRRDSHLL